MVFSFIQRFFSVLFAFLVALCTNTPAAERRTEPVFTGSFLQSWYSSQFNDEQWENEIAQMKKDGIEHLIIQSVAEKNLLSTGGKWTVYYDIDLPEFKDADFGPNVVEKTLKALKGTGIKVYIGLSLFEDFWYQGGFTDQYEECCRISASLVRDIYSRYGEEYKDTIAGFYFTPEFSNIIWESASAITMSKGVNIIIDEMNKVCPDLPLVMSPFYTNYLTLGTVDAVGFWSKLITYINFRDGDIIAPQDAVGAAFTNIDELEKNWKMYRALIDNADADIKLWANCESFKLAREKSIISGIGLPPATENTLSVPATMDRFAYQLDVASYYCDNIITFSYNHYLCENAVDSRFIEAYRQYVANGYEVEKECPVLSDEFTAKTTDEGVSLSWEKAVDNMDIAYYRITKNGKFLVRHECMYGDGILAYTDTEGKATDKYVITAYDTSGNASNSVAASFK